MPGNNLHANFSDNSALLVLAMILSANLFIAGYPKSGTSVMWKYLREHPDIAVGSKKETYALLKKPPHPYVGPIVGQPRSGWAARWCYLQEYWGKQAHYYLDASPDYLYFPDIPDIIHNLEPTAKIIICLREPLSYYRSLHEQWRRCGMFHGTQISLDLTPLGRDGVPGLSRLNYVDQIAGVTRRFGPDQLKIALFEEFKRDNASFMTGVWSFLGLSPVNITLREEVDGYALELEDGYYERGRERLRPHVQQLADLLRNGGYLTEDLTRIWDY